MTQMLLFDGISIPPAPGQVLKRRLLGDTGLTQVELARALGISTPRLNMILKGRCQLSPEIALRIERVFGISPQFWLRVRADYEIFEERRRMSRQLDQLTQHESGDQDHLEPWRMSAWQVAA